MKKTVFVFIAGIFATIQLKAQPGKLGETNDSLGLNNIVCLGLNVPFAEFSETHFGGMGLHYLWSHHRFGKSRVLSKKLIGFTAHGGIDYYFGKKETVAGYPYRYGGYLYLQAMAGAIYNFRKKDFLNSAPMTPDGHSGGRGIISLTTGPTMGIYKGNADIGFGLNLDGSYYLTDRIAITAGILFLKHYNAAPLWVSTVGTAFSF
jgi:hypothetical protein